MAKVGTLTLEQALRAKVAQQAAVARLGQLVLGGADPAKVMDEAVQALVSTLGTQFASVLEARPDGRFLARADAGWEPPLTGLVIQAPQALYSVRSGTPVVTQDLFEDPRFSAPEAEDDYGDRSGMSVPINVRGSAYGVVSSYSRSARSFTADDIHFLESVAVLVASALDRRTTEDEIRHQALHDRLTGLPNRLLLTDRVATALRRLERSAGTVTVLSIDVDRFKLVNDAMSHAAGDQLLVELAHRLEQTTRSCDTVARFGGDEFVVLCEYAGHASGTTALAQRLASVTEAPFQLDGRDVFVSLSIGVSVTSDPAAEASTVLADADAAMYSAKERGRSGSAVFDESLRTRATDRLRVGNELRTGISNGQLRVYYQPLVRLEDEAIVGVEALVRWQHPTRGLVPPNEFIPVAEDTGLILPLGRWVLAQACRQVQAWRASGTSPQLRLAVNLSARQLSEQGLPETVAAVLRSTELPAGSLTLEVTESMLMEDPDASIAVLERLSNMGVHIAVDDFGTGYSSLSYLRRLPVDELKIDRSFVSGIATNTDDLAIVRAVISLAHSLGLGTLAEGVETREQLDRLRDLGCERAQGYLFSRPVGPLVLADRLTKLLLVS